LPCEEGDTGIGVEREQDSRKARQQSRQDVGAGDHPAGVDAGEPRGLLVATDREQIPAIDRAVQQQSHMMMAMDDEKNERHRQVEKFSAGQVLQRLETCRPPKPLVVSFAM